MLFVHLGLLFAEVTCFGIGVVRGGSIFLMSAFFDASTSMKIKGKSMNIIENQRKNNEHQFKSLKILENR